MGVGTDRTGAPARMAAAVLAGVCAVACGLPRDPNGTLEHVRGGTVRIGLVENPPWVVRTSGEPAGAEVELARRLAADLGATPEWFWGSEQEHMEALERFELDLVVGGLTQKTPWRTRVGLTSPYFEDRIVVGVPASAPPLHDIRGVQVEAKRGNAAAALLEKQGAVVLRVDEPGQANRPAAAPDWELQAWGFTPSGPDLVIEKHVMAAPPGENGWLKHLDEFLAGQGPEVKALLQQEEEATAR